jgi:hypothetical protein
MAQCLEKLMKGVLLANGLKIKGERHDLIKLFGKTKNCMGDLLPEEFLKPDGVSSAIWDQSTLLGFIQRINQIGDPNSRYGIVSWHRMDDDLFKFDQLVALLRRCTVGLDWLVGDAWPCEAELEEWCGHTYREALLANRNYQVRGCLEKSEDFSSTIGGSNAEILTFLNFEFCNEPNEEEREAAGGLQPTIGPLRNSHLFLCWSALDRQESLPSSFLNGMEWIAEDILPNGKTRCILEGRIQERRENG